MLDVSHFGRRIDFWHFQGDWRCIERDTADLETSAQKGRHLHSAWSWRKGVHLEGTMEVELPLEDMKELPLEGTEGTVGIQTRAN